MLFNQIFTFSALAFAASSLAATCVPNKSCAALPKSAVSSCSKVISAKKAKLTTCTVLKTVVPQKTTKTVTVSRPKATIFKNEWVTATKEETGTVSVFSTVTEYTTTVFLEEVPATTTATEVLSFTESTTITETSTSTIFGFALKRRAAATLCSAVPKSCSCLLTKTTTKTVTAPRQTITTTRTLPLETVFVKKTATASVTIVTFVTTVVVDSTTSTESQYSTYTITAIDTTQTSKTATQTFTATVQAIFNTCVDPNRRVCGNYCYHILADWYNCGGCGIRCGISQFCRDGVCQNF
ncbi:uncharacterized protein DFL_003757 [Arthrobotrys flagrans]|uniref:ShKT domain-containing protein n=1 Tax=Arthrobotrys flagrans TaxID=97331 RepID=A0A437A2R0_ARTFL|nr:hypothetical protein DFL_003757 [Arthrobotrys flagrans]